jgi:hypothetical protein
MKKNKINTVAAIAVYVMLGVVLSSCSRIESVNEKPSETITTGSATTYYSIRVIDYNASGMHYKVFNSADGNVFVVNVTKDSLDITKNRR